MTVSIIIRTYNRGHIVGWAIKSALSQTYRDIEVLVVDDGSTDNTAEVVAQFDDPRLRYMPLPHNGNISDLANLGIRETTGEYIAFLDSDDLYMPEFVETLMDAMRIDGTELAYCWIGSYREPITTNHYEAALRQGYLFQGGAFIASRRAYGIVGGYDTSFACCIDDDISFRFARVFRLTLVPQVLELMGGASPDQVTQQREQYAREWQHLFDKWGGEVVRVCGAEALERHRKSERGRP